MLDVFVLTAVCGARRHRVANRRALDLAPTREDADDDVPVSDDADEPLGTL